MAMHADIMDLPGEEWRPVPEYEGYYECSSFGRFRTVERDVRKKSHWHDVGYYVVRQRSRIRRPSNSRAYSEISLSRDGAAKMHQAHTLICTAFHGPRPYGLECAHHDGDGRNNRATNLRWATSKENHADKARHGTTLKGEQVGNAKLTEAPAREIISRSHENKAALAREFGIHRVHLFAIIAGRSWKHLPRP